MATRWYYEQFPGDRFRAYQDEWHSGRFPEDGALTFCHFYRVSPSGLRTLVVGPAGSEEPAAEVERLTHLTEALRRGDEEVLGQSKETLLGDVARYIRYHLDETCGDLGMNSEPEWVEVAQVADIIYDWPGAVAMLEQTFGYAWGRRALGRYRYVRCPECSARSRTQDLRVVGGYDRIGRDICWECRAEMVDADPSEQRLPDHWRDSEPPIDHPAWELLRGT